MGASAGRDAAAGEGGEAAAALAGGDDPLRYGPRPDALVAKQTGARQCGADTSCGQGVGAKGQPGAAVQSRSLACCAPGRRTGMRTQAVLEALGPGYAGWFLSQLAGNSRPASTIPRISPPCSAGAAAADEERGGGGGGDGVYRPPRLNPVSMELDERGGDLTAKERRQLVQAQRRAARSGVVQVGRPVHVPRLLCMMYDSSPRCCATGRLSSGGVAAAWFFRKR